MKTKKTKRRFIASIVPVLCIALLLPLFIVGCGVTLVYSGGGLMTGQVGVEYSAYVGTASGADEITYTLKDGSELPSGLELDADGFVTGIPEQKCANSKFTVVAAADKSTAEAEFSLNIEAGVVAYEGGNVKVATGIAFEKSVATATGAVKIEYALAADSAPLPDGVALAADGTLAGTADKISENSFTVTATAVDCAPATAEFTLSVVKPWLDYVPAALQTATAGSYFTGSVASAVDGTGAESAKKITYKLKSGTTLPAGLNLSSIGLVYGVPEAAGTAKFTVIASASGFTAAEAEFTLKTNPEFTFAVTDGKIKFAGGDTVETEVNTVFIQTGAVKASATNRQPITFEITDGAMPAGVKFYPNGTVAGTATKPGTYEFTLRATAKGCDPVEKKYSFAVLVTLLYKNVNYSAAAANDLYVGEKCELSLATAAFPAGYEDSDAVIEYSVKSGLPDGLTLSADGILSGTPQKSARTVALAVTASAEGFSAKTATFTLHIEDALVFGVSRFEVEYTDLRNLTGSGYSGSASGANMIGSNEVVKASRSKDGKTSEEVIGGYYIPYVYGPITFTFNITSDRVANGAKLSLGLDSEIGSLLLDQKSFAVAVNGTVITYSANVRAAEGKLSEFKNYVIGTANLKEGSNVITVSVLENNLNGTATGGPAVDYLELDNLGGATLSWRPALYNLPSLTQA